MKIIEWFLFISFNFIKGFIMKATFKLSISQRISATESCKSFADWLEYHDDDFCPPQKQSLRVQGNFLLWEGPRHCLQTNEFIEIFGDLENAEKALVRLETSDPRLRVFETLDEYLSIRASLYEARDFVLKSLESGKTRYNAYYYALERKDIKNMLRIGKNSFQKPRLMSAQYSYNDLAPAREFYRKLREYNEAYCDMLAL